MLLRLVLSVAAGLSLWLAFPGHDLWWMAYLGIGALALATVGVGFWRGFGLGLVAGLAYFVPLLSWTGIFVGSLPWMALSVLEALYIAGIGAVCGFLQRRGVRPLTVALAWVVSELARSTTPFGGFPWGRVAFSQADAPLLAVASVLGTPGVTFVASLVGGLLALVAQLLLTRPSHTGTPGEKGRHGIRLAWQTPTAALAALALLLGPLLIPRPIDGEPLQVIGIQGNVPEMTLEFNAQRRAVLDMHVATTKRAAELVEAGELPEPDLVLWPENSSDIDPLRNADAATVINEALDAVGVPLIVGGVLREPENHVSNASLLYLPGQGVVDRYIKQRPVPFAEYIPYRDFFRLFSDKVDLVARDFAAGDEPGVMSVPVASGDLVLGIAICFEVVVDDLMRENVREGAEVLFVPTNNATFGFTDESEQQLAASRVKAVELARPVVHVSTVGVSGVIQPDGSVVDKTELFTQDIISGSVPRRTDLTLAVQLGPWPERVALIGLVVLLAGAVLRRRNS
ncbi:apolipoprotein N-acyltransferase [Ornithinimicrobium faecis]|uniref:Apolipoprotein N-acyltransferase n=1 Tax=Ornithinimicrobium faecis TaxID=2934158 RepID=A0ABY4YNC1_9MICO|nr:MULTISPECIES: apolipoprotein N-acyltransferase [unclassified Ornithinimicrobium]USQ78179.1 apolipoprotein N-acyltransferase [Ornithinimicrobium sp. HY1793]